MYNREQLAISLFYASNTDEQTGSKVAILTLQTMDPDGGVLQSSKLYSITDPEKNKSYRVGEQNISDGSDSLLVAIENYWRENPESVISELMTEVMDFISGGISQSATWIGQHGMKIFENEAISSRLPIRVLDADVVS